MPTPIFMICDRFSQLAMDTVLVHLGLHPLLPFAPSHSHPGEMPLDAKQPGEGFLFLSRVGGMRVFHEKAQIRVKQRFWGLPEQGF